MKRQNTDASDTKECCSSVIQSQHSVYSTGYTEQLSAREYLIFLELCLLAVDLPMEVIQLIFHSMIILNDVTHMWKYFIHENFRTYSHEDYILDKDEKLQAKSNKTYDRFWGVGPVLSEIHEYLMVSGKVILNRTSDPSRIAEETKGSSANSMREYYDCRQYIITHGNTSSLSLNEKQEEDEYLPRWSKTISLVLMVPMNMSTRLHTLLEKEEEADNIEYIIQEQYILLTKVSEIIRVFPTLKGQYEQTSKPVCLPSSFEVLKELDDSTKETTADRVFTMGMPFFMLHQQSPKLIKKDAMYQYFYLPCCHYAYKTPWDVHSITDHIAYFIPQEIWHTLYGWLKKEKQY